MWKRKLWTIWLGVVLGILCGSGFVYAETTIETEVTITQNNVVITGTIPNVSETAMVTLRVKAGELILYIDQVKSNAVGEFTFTFALPKDLPDGEYPYQIGSNTDAETYTGTISYQRTDPIQAEFAMLGRNITITGTVPNVSKEEMVALRIGEEGSLIHIDQVRSNEEGEFAFTFDLPNGLAEGEYSYYVGSNARSIPYNGTFFYEDEHNVQVDASVLGKYVTITGRVPNVNQGAMVTLRVDGENAIVYINQVRSNALGEFAFTFDLPKDLSNGNYTYQIGTNAGTAYYHGTLAYGLQETASCQIVGNKDDIVRVAVSGNNMVSLENKVFTLGYTETNLEAVSLWGTYFQDEVGTGQKGNIEVISYTPGKITFRIVDKEIPEGKVWNGVINIVKFKLLNESAGDIIITMQ